MLPGFEDQTGNLKPEEIRHVPRIAAGLSKRIGKKNAITNDAIRKALQAEGIKIPPARVRKIIAFIRDNDLLQGLLASGNGYYVSDNPEEISAYIKSIDGRIYAIHKVKNSMLRHLAQLTNDKTLKIS